MSTRSTTGQTASAVSLGAAVSPPCLAHRAGQRQTCMCSLGGGGGGLEVGVGHEGHLGDDGRVGAAAHRHLHLRAGLGVGLGHVPHRDVLLQARAECTAGHLTDLAPHTAWSSPI